MQEFPIPIQSIKEAKKDGEWYWVIGFDTPNVETYLKWDVDVNDFQVITILKDGRKYGSYLKDLEDNY